MGHISAFSKEDSVHYYTPGECHTSQSRVTCHDIMRSHLATLRYNDVHFGFVVGPHGGVLDLPDDEHAVNDAAEHHVFPVQEVAPGGRDEKLAAVGVLAAVGHGEQPGLGVLDREVLVGEGGARVYRHAARPVPVHEVPALDHEVLDHAVEGGALVAQGNTILHKDDNNQIFLHFISNIFKYTNLAILASTELAEILCSLGHHVCEEFHHDAADVGGAHGHVEEDHRVVGVPQLGLDLGPAVDGCHCAVAEGVGGRVLLNLNFK